MNKPLILAVSVIVVALVVSLVIGSSAKGTTVQSTGFRNY